MLLLTIFLLSAIGFSFLCSIAEAVILSISPSYVPIFIEERPALGERLKHLKDDINRPLAAILSLNTIAHTVGAAGTGAQATKLFGDQWIGLISAVLTFLILVFSEIIPKTLGARYWRQLAPATTIGLHYLVVLFYPFVLMSEWMTRLMVSEKGSDAPSREEFSAMASLSEEEGHLEPQEVRRIMSLLDARNTTVQKILTPRRVVFSVEANMTVDTYIKQHREEMFSRVPVFKEDPEHLIGFALRSEIFLAHARGESSKSLLELKRELPAIHSTMPVTDAFDKCQEERVHILQVIDEHGGLSGLVAMEDLIETLLATEIVDEGDKITDMQKLSKRLWRRHLKFLKNKNPS